MHVHHRAYPCMPTSTHTHMHTHAPPHGHECACTHSHTHKCAHNTHMHTYMHAHTRAHECTHPQACTYIHTCIHTYSFAHICMHTHIHKPYGKGSVGLLSHVITWKGRCGTQSRPPDTAVDRSPGEYCLHPF